MSAATCADVFAKAEAHYKNLAIVDTWGHLFPEGIYYEGYVRIAHSIYSQYEGAVLAEKIDISSSPWWYDAITEFAFEVNKDMEDGEVADFKISVTVETVLEEYPWYLEDNEIEGYERESHKKLNIALQQKIIVAKGY